MGPIKIAKFFYSTVSRNGHSLMPKGTHYAALIRSIHIYFTFIIFPCAFCCHTTNISVLSTDSVSSKQYITICPSFILLLYNPTSPDCSASTWRLLTGQPRDDTAVSSRGQETFLFSKGSWLVLTPLNLSLMSNWGSLSSDTAVKACSWHLTTNQWWG